MSNINIFVIVGAVTSALLADLPNLQTLITQKNWTGLTTNIVGLVQTTLQTMFAVQNGEEVPHAHVQAVIDQVTRPVGK